jgi:hypothetical protein
MVSRNGDKAEDPPGCQHCSHWHDDGQECCVCGAAKKP